MLKKYIITGAPGTGKSTLIKGLQSKGVLCGEEVSRAIIIREQFAKGDGMPWNNMERFSQLVFEETMLRFKTQKNTVICDRSLVDIIAYLKHAQMEVLKPLDNIDFHQYYHEKVFVASPWATIYKTDPQRPEPFQAQLALSKIIESVYLSYGFTLCYLPCVTVEERISFVMDECSFS
ncbi:MAG: AAA family ATPase [Flavobacteriaceae bacterium]|nr:AAA family ATPase [Flavobacteriaceae bacterium]